MDEGGKMPKKKVVVSVIEHNPVSGIHASTISLPKPFVAQTVLQFSLINTLLSRPPSSTSDIHFRRVEKRR